LPGDIEECPPDTRAAEILANIALILDSAPKIKARLIRIADEEALLEAYVARVREMVKDRKTFERLTEDDIAKFDTDMRVILTKFDQAYSGLGTGIRHLTYLNEDVREYLATHRSPNVCEESGPDGCIKKASCPYPARLCDAKIERDPVRRAPGLFDQEV
jgi:hypothetical protein